VVPAADRTPLLVADTATCPSSAPDEVSASTQAHRCASRILVAEATDETSQTFANPDGTYTWESSVRPRFARAADGSWVPADATLVTNADGSVSPKASTFPMVFSGGGTAALITANRGGKALSLSWKGTLPKPVLSGNMATYPDVMSGVDLRVIADVDGFSEHVVLKNRAAAALAKVRSLRLNMTGTGLTIRRDATGGLSAVDAGGDAVFSAGTPLMWDSSHNVERTALLESGDYAAAEGVLPKIRNVGLAVDNGDLVLTPDAAMLDDASAVYPVVIDPTVVGAKNHWIELSKSDPTVSYWDAPDGTFATTDSTNGLARVGLSDWQSPVYTMRPVFEMNTTAVKNVGKVTAASFRLAQRWSGVKCTDTPPPSNVGLYWTPPITSTTNWNTSWNLGGSGWTNRIGVNAEAHRTDMTGATCGPADVTFDLTGSISTMGLGGYDTLTLGLKGEDETVHSTWKRYLNDAANSPTLSITYDAKPVVNSVSTSPSTSCVTGSGRPVIPSVAPTLSANVSDPEGHTLSATFEWWAVGGSTAIGSATVSNVASGTTASKQISSGQLTGGGNYQWRVTVSDGSTPVTSSWCEFTTMVLDPPAAGCPATLTPGDFNGDGVRDRVIADPKATVNSVSNAGAVYLLDGASGAERTLQEGLDGVPDSPESNDQFGYALSVYDANRDGCADLAVGVPFEDIGTTVDGGVVYLIYGSPTGLGKGPAALTIQQGAALPNGRGTVPDSVESSDWFGYSVSGGVTSAGESFLIIGAPGEDQGSNYDAGTVHYLRGAVDVKFDGQSPQGAESDDREGFSVASSPYQFAIGVPGEAAAAGTEQAGAVCVLNHNSGATAPTGIRCFVQGDDTTGDTAERGDWFGKSIAMVPYRPVGAAAGVADSLLAVGAPGEDIGTVADAGYVHQFLVTTTTGSQLAMLAQGSSGISGSNEAGDYWGERVVLVNRNPSAEASASTVLIAVGKPGENLAAAPDFGTIRVFPAGTATIAASTTIERGAPLPGTVTTQELIGGWLYSDGTNLLVPSPYSGRAVFVIPWANLASGNATPTVTYAPGQGGIPASTVSFGLAVG
jgi:FG-GAP repeat